MIEHIRRLVLAIILCAVTAQAKIPEGPITDWLICGPFPNPPSALPEPGEKSRCVGLDTDYLLEHGGEANIVPTVGMKHTKKDGATVEWFEHASPEWKVVFRKAITRQADVVGYAYRVVTAEKAGRYLMGLGSDEGVRLWLNGKEIHYNYIKRTIQQDDDLIPVHLKKGENRILIKVEQRKGGWGFTMHFLPENWLLSSIRNDTTHFTVRVSLRMGSSPERKEAELRANGKRVATGPLLIEDPSMPIASTMISLPWPAPGTGADFAQLDVVVNGEKLGTIDMPDFGKLRIEEFRWRAPRGFPGFVFEGEKLPKMDFERPQWIEALIGPYTISSTFYDADYNEVTEAKKPGRYGAVVDIKSTTLETRRLVTIFRQESEVSWDDYELDDDLGLPKELGTSPDVAEDYGEFVHRFLRGQISEGLRRDQYSAKLLAAMKEAETDGVKAGFYSEPNLRDRVWWLGLKRKLYGADKKYPDPFVCPVKQDGPPANVVRKGSLREAGMKKDFAKRLHKHLKAWENDTDEAFAVIVVRHGVIAFHKAYGTRDGKPMTLETRSWMASTTKMMSATLIMMLVDQGLLSLDDRADKFLPPLRHPDKEWPATIRNLYMHTAGLRGHWGSWMSDMEHRVAEKIPYFTVNKQCAYDGAGLEVACKVLEVISGETLPQFYQNHLFEPLGIKDTHVADACGGAGSVPLDMAKIGQVLLQKGAYGNMRFFSEKTFEQMLPRKSTPDKPIVGGEYGIGTTYFKHENMGEGTFAHGAASSATTRIDPTNDLVVVMTRNTQGTYFGKYHQAFIDIIMDSLE